MLIKWAHLSDIHYMYKNYETTVMRDKLIEYLESNKNDVDYLFITGDITHKGSEYSSEVISFLDDVIAAIEIEKSEIFLVPGNHDIKRNPMADRLVANILSSNDAKQEINSLDDDTYQFLVSGQQPFFDFYRSFLGDEYPKDALHFVKKREGFNVIHINTCLAAGTTGSEGNILVGLNKLYETFKQIPDDDTINIAIGHHTIGCIHESEKESLLHRFSDAKIDIYLNGHVHRAKYHHDTNNYNETYFFTSGSFMVDEYSDPLFMTGFIDTEEASGEVVYHKWNSRGEFWHIDNTVGRKAKTGNYPFEINRLKKKTNIAECQHLKSEVDEVDVDEDDFKDFLIDFHTTLSSGYQVNEALVPKDITEKFVNMLCSPTFRYQFDKCSIYFPIINKMLGTTSFFGIDKRFIIPNVIFTEYLHVLYSQSNGDLILLHMINNLYSKYGSKVSYSEDRLKSYIRILIFWSIYECDIFNEDKRQKDVI
ncbi:metallophosphoesterase family protein [Brevibacillus sp. SIMBA_040]|uniref:metallophosphoesterase family protein n=1 Tax=unclassified Brevibacillus TaxID=2684853 RepID=UPI003979BA25